MPHLLIVDDHYIIRTGLKQVIETFLAHTTVEEAFDGDSALEKVKHCDYDLIILDVNMPNTDSFGLLSNVLALKPNTKVLMFSMNDEGIYAKRYLSIGARGYIRKDASPGEIQKAITTVLNNKKFISAELGEKLLNDLQNKEQSQNPFDKLSPREFEIVQHLTRGESVAEISQNLKLHTSTIGTHKARIFDKLDCHNIIDLSELAKVHNVITTS
jgi:two-component system, NarL family, invasion response regulator UvrY